MSELDFTCQNLSWHIWTWLVDLTCPRMPYTDLPLLTWPVLTRPGLKLPGLTGPVLTWLALKCPSVTFNTPHTIWASYGYPPDTIQTPSRHPSDNLQAQTRHFQDTHRTSTNFKHVGSFLLADARCELFFFFFHAKTKSTPTYSNWSWVRTLKSEWSLTIVPSGPLACVESFGLKWWNLIGDFKGS